MKNPAWRRPLSVIALMLLVAAVFWPGLSGYFLFDDYPNIVSEQRIQIEELTLDGLLEATKAYGGALSRPIPTVSFAIDHLVWGMDPWGFKLTNLLIHLCNTLLVLALVLRLFQSAGAGRSKESYFVAAWFLALLWAAHPLQVSTVLYVVQRMEILAVTFMLAGLLAYLEGRARQLVGGRSWPWLLASCGLLLLAMLCKESAIQFPLYTLALELTLLRFRAASPTWQRAWRIGYIGLAVLAFLAAATIAIPHYAQPEVFAIRDFGAWERVLTQARVLPMYIGWTLFPQPHNLIFYYDTFQASRGILEPAITLAGLAFLVSLLTAAFLVRSTLPLASLGVFWFFASHVITSAPLPLELVFEHRNYFSILGVLIVAGELVRRLPFDPEASMRYVALGALAFGVLSITTIRSATWGDQLHLAMELVANNPNSSRASADLGEQYMHFSDNNPDSPFYSMAITEFERGAALPNASIVPEQGLILMAATSGREADAAWWDSLISKLETQTIGPQDFTTITGLLSYRNGGLEFDDDRFSEAYAILAERLNMPAAQYYAFAQHALQFTADSQLAHRLLAEAVDRAQHEPEIISLFISLLLERGFDYEATLVIEHARARGVNVEIIDQ
ncbi:hypothetical protein [Alkalisalibacterium limincola]|uniref:Tetratricopeptide repeat protein n=1 Tax=Alkalisalibacterium limincola TaxID=2699169 RepID=A0A5C8KWL0_9GAMM|nr:hypothetical protein [Alkalisalibacterium limincola]TXK65030.1 hypothetical protein FU658_04340 [Alkalisalibacterium limincola]